MIIRAGWNPALVFMKFNVCDVLDISEVFLCNDRYLPR